jgi:signal transduction histidine kinase
MSLASEFPPGPIEALDAFVDVLGDAEAGVTTDAFYGRVCQVICRLAGMDRAVLFRYDAAIRRVRVAGAHGVDVAIFEDVQASVESTPIAKRAFEEDAVVQTAAPFDGELPDEYLPLLPGGTLSCVPLAAGGRWMGVVLCHRSEGGPLSHRERHLLWTLGKSAALAAVARIATFEGERARELQHRIDLARDVHDSVVQRLFGVSLALDGDGPLPAGERIRAAAEIQQALADLRSAMQRPLSRAARPTQVTLADEVKHLAHRHADLSIEIAPDSVFDVPPHLESLAQSVLAEALRNAHKHAKPTRVLVRTGTEQGAFILEVANDGVRTAKRPSTGMGLRLVAFEALREGGFVEFGPRNGGWQVRLVVPVDVDS